MISVVVCSIVPAKFAALRANLALVMRGVNYETVGIHDARSLCEGFNRGLARSRGDVTIFCHDDIEILDPNFARKLEGRLAAFDALGVAGTTRMVDMGWATAGQPWIHGFVAHGVETGLKLVSGFTVGVGAAMEFTIDFNLRKSVVQPPGQTADTPMCDGQAYLLKPALRMVNTLEVGTITGTIASDVPTAATCPANELGKVYLFGPYTTTAPVPDDFDLNTADGSDAVASAMVEVDQNSDNRYTIGFVPPGQYVVAYTCAADDPAVDADLANTPAGADEVVTFIPRAGVATSAVANQTTRVPEVTVPVP